MEDFEAKDLESNYETEKLVKAQEVNQTKKYQLECGCNSF